ncbi:ATP-grasp domain-containing protein [Candidatus Dojkabacteria bacterium]|nr:ATP-grasp domain-containing protein [Candidatus Dojkabacteria bacterium]
MKSKKQSKNYLKIAGNIHLSYYVEAADILGIDYKIFVRSLMARFEANGKHWFIINTVNPLINSPSATIAKRKYLTNMVLEEAGVPVPKQNKLSSIEDALEFYNKFQVIVIKPAQGLGGKGVTILPEDENAVRKAYRAALENNKSKTSTKILGEEFIPGNHYRLLVLGNHVIGAVRRVPADVSGDGVHTISELIKLENKKRKERLLKPIPVDDQTHKKLNRQNLTLDSVLPKDQRVEIRFHANLTTGGSTEECAEEMHKFYEETAVNAVKATGMKFGGVDLITPDISKPARCAINEVNYNPGLRPHYKVDRGKIVKVAVPVMKYIRDNF